MQEEQRPAGLPKKEQITTGRRTSRLKNAEVGARNVGIEVKGSRLGRGLQSTTVFKGNFDDLVTGAIWNSIVIDCVSSRLDEPYISTGEPIMTRYII